MWWRHYRDMLLPLCAKTQHRKKTPALTAFNVGLMEDALLASGAMRDALSGVWCVSLVDADRYGDR